MSKETDKALDRNYVFGLKDTGKKSKATLLPPGEYRFKVRDYREYDGTETEYSIACPKGMITLEVYSGKADEFAVTTDWVQASEDGETKLVAFMRAIGLFKEGKGFTWDDVAACVDRYGRAEFTVGKPNADGSQFNRVKKYLEPQEGDVATDDELPF